MADDADDWLMTAEALAQQLTTALRERNEALAMVQSLTN